MTLNLRGDPPYTESGTGSKVFQSKDLAAIYAYVEAERERLGHWAQKGRDAPRYSVCMSNYNMADTLEQAISSVAEQLNDQYEIIIIDDGSNDGSLGELQKLADRYEIVRYLALPRDRRRLLGITRNISIRAARGEYVLLHIDADDVWEPYLQDFVTLFHKIEELVDHDFYLSGQQTGMAKRALMVAHGPYRNIYRCEDRDMMFRLAENDQIMYLDYRVYRTRLNRPAGKKLIKVARDTWSHMMYDLRQDAPRGRYIWGVLTGPFRKNHFSFVISILRAFLVFPIYIASRFQEKLSYTISWEEFHAHHMTTRGTFPELMERLGGDPDMSFLSPEAQKVYSYKIKSKGFKSE